MANHTQFKGLQDHFLPRPLWQTVPLPNSSCHQERSSTFRWIILGHIFTSDSGRTSQPLTNENRGMLCSSHVLISPAWVGAKGKRNVLNIIFPFGEWMIQCQSGPPAEAPGSWHALCNITLLAGPLASTTRPPAQWVGRTKEEKELESAGREVEWGGRGEIGGACMRQDSIPLSLHHHYTPWFCANKIGDTECPEGKKRLSLG